MNSMMDIFIIILLFLLKTYSAHGRFLSQEKDLQLPYAKFQNHVNIGLELVVTNETIFVEKQPVAEMHDVVYNKPPIVVEGIVVPLYKVLYKYALQAQKMEKKYGIKFNGSIVIKANKNLDYKDLVKIMQTCGKATFANMHLAVANQ